MDHRGALLAPPHLSRTRATSPGPRTASRLVILDVPLAGDRSVVYQETATDSLRSGGTGAHRPLTLMVSDLLDKL